MLSKRDRQLLTAFVDGEMTGRHSRLVERLLERSEDARTLLQKLQDDARRLANLPAPRLGRDLSSSVLGAIASGQLPPRGGLARRPRHLPAWAGLAAAGLLVGLGLASFLYFSALLQHRHAPLIAKADSTTAPRPADPHKAAAKTAAPRQASSTNNATRPQERQQPAAGPGNKAAPLEASPPPAATQDKDVFTDRMEVFQMDQVELSLPVLFKLHHLDQSALRSQLVAELRRDRDFRLELPCRAGTRALERLQHACKGLGFTLVIDALAQERLKTPQLAASYAVYIEDCSPEEVARLLARAGLEDSKAAGGKPLEIQFDRLVLARMTPRDHKELSVLLGVDPTKAAAAPPPQGADPRQPLSERTARQVSESLAGQGGTPRPEPGKSVTRPGEHGGLVVIFNPARPHPGSAEVKRYLEGRKPARPGTLRILLVLRG